MNSAKDRSTTNLLLGHIFDRKPQHEQIYDWLKDVYDERFYHYGNHFKYQIERRKSLADRVARVKYEQAIGAIVFLLERFKQKRPSVISTAYFGVGSIFNENFGINETRPPWMYNSKRSNVFDHRLFSWSNTLRKKFVHSNFHELTSDPFIEEVKAYQRAFKEFVVQNDIQALFLPHDVGFFEKLAVSTFKELGRPSFAFVHGLQFWLNKYDFSRADYLVVWGELLKKDFVDHGANPNRILVSGHPSYQFPNNNNLRSGLDDVLVLSLSLNGIAPSQEYFVSDRTNCIYYLNLVQESLMKQGVTSSRLRPHPSENPEWYQRNIDTKFFKLDKQPLAASLSSSTLVIGPTSTVFLDALQHGVNYLVFNPENQTGKGLNGILVPSLYNGNHPKVPVAKTQPELEQLLSQNKTVDISIVKELMAEEFSLKQVFEIIQSSRSNN